MSDLRFETFGALYSLWLLVLVYFLNKAYQRRLSVHFQKQISSRLMPFLTASLSLKRRKIKTQLIYLTLILMLVAYARPQTPEGKQKVKNEGIEILILFDVSNSMLAQDVRPSRIDVAKSELKRFVDASVGHRIGIVAFAGSAVLLSPMTTDLEAIKMYIDAMSPDVVSSQGTVFAKALNEASEAFKRGGLGEQAGVQVTRAVLIASDGEDNEEGALEFAEKLVESGIHIFTLGLGTEQGGAIPIHDESGVLRGYKRDKSGELIMSKTNGTILKSLAQKGKGTFHHAAFQGDAIASIRRDIDNLKKSQFESGEISSFDEKYQYVLFMAFLLALIELILSDRKNVGRIWKGRFEVAGD